MYNVLEQTLILRLNCIKHKLKEPLCNSSVTQFLIRFNMRSWHLDEKIRLKDEGITFHVYVIIFNCC